MKIKKANAVLALLSILFLLMHVFYSVYAYLTMYYNPILKYVFSIPFMVTVCLHAVLGMISVFTRPDGFRTELYPKQNLRTILQRVSAALIFPLLILHINTFSLMQTCKEKGYLFLIFLLIIGEILFFAAVITHVAVSITRAFLTLGILTSQKTQKRIDTAVYCIGAVVFILSVIAVVRGQVLMFFG